MATEGHRFARTVADLNERNAQTREQLARTRLVADRLWELWTGEAATLLGAEWELADGRARALVDEELAIIALLAPAHAEGAREEHLEEVAGEEAAGLAAKNPRGMAWDRVELLELMQEAARHFHAQERELRASLDARGELIERAERDTGGDGAGYAREHRLWLRRAQEVVERLRALGAGVHAAREAYVKAGGMNARMFRANLFAEPVTARSPESSGAEEEVAGLYGQLSPTQLYALGDTLVGATERLLKALIAAELALESASPLARGKERAWAEDYDLRSQAVFLLAGDCLHALGLLTRSVRQAGRNWEVTEFNAGGGRGVLPEAAKVREVVEMRIAPPPSAVGGGEARVDALERAEAAWRTLAGDIDTLDKAVVAASGFDSSEAQALEYSIGHVAGRLCSAQDAASEIADMCARLRAHRQLPWWRRSSLQSGHAEGR